MKTKTTLGRLGQITMVILITITVLLVGALIVVKKLTAEVELGSKWINEQAWKGLDASNKLVA